MFRPSYSAVNRHDQEPPKGFWANLARGAFLLFYFTLVPILTLIVVNWLVFFFTQNNFYQESWMSPALAILSCIIAGSLIRQRIEDELGGMGLFTLGIIGLILFGWITYQDVHTMGGLYSRFMPRFLSIELTDYIFAFPAIGVMGMLAYKYFTVKHYS